MVEWPTIEGHGNAPIEAFLHASKDSTSRRMNYSTQGRYWNSSVEAPEDPRQNPESPMLGAEPRLEFSDEARNQLPALIPKFITEISHSLATLQEFVESTTISATGTTLTNQNLMSVLTLCSDLIRTMASQVDGFENSIKHGASRQLLKAKDLFSPGDFNQQIADVLSIQAARKDVEVVVRNPYDSFLSAGYDFHLMFYDQDFLRQLLLHVFTGVIRNSLPGSVVHQNFFFSDIQTDNDLNPTMDRMLATAMQLRLEAVFQIKYYSIVDLETSPVDANSFYLKKLEDLGGSVKKWAEGDVHIEEIHVRCQGIPFANISRLLKYFEPISQFPYALNELISFTRKLAGYKVVLHSSKSSAFLDNMSSFLRAWGADVTVIALSKELEILYEISQADKRCAQDKEDPHTRHVLITDELEHLSALLRQFMGFSRLDHLILFTSILDFESVKVKVEITYTQMEKRAPHMLVMTKPCGPERLLFALRCSEEGRQDSVARPLSVRTNSEIDEFPKLRKTLETLPRRSETLFGDADLSQFVTILLVEDNLVNQTIISSFLQQIGVSFDVAKDGAEAVDMFKKKKYHVILMDLIMPVMSGTEATQEIRRIEAEHRRTGSSSIDSIIIALTASTLTEDHQMAMKAGCNDFILKPVSLRWLERKVREWGNIQGVIDYQNLEEAVERKYGDKK